MGSLCGSNSQTITAANTVSNPWTLAQQNLIYGAGDALYGQYSGNPSSLVAPFNNPQQAALQGISQFSEGNVPWNTAAEGIAGQGTVNLGNVGQIQGMAYNPSAYMSPYVQSVADATQNEFNNQNAQQDQQFEAYAAQNGALFGGDRAGIGLAQLQNQQQLAQAPVIAGLYNTGFTNAQTANAAQQNYGLNLGATNNQNQLAAAQAYGNIGSTLGSIANNSQNTTESGLNSLMQAGTQLQGTTQQQLSSPLTLASWLNQTSPGVQTVPVTTNTIYPPANPLGAIISGGVGLGVLGSVVNNGFNTGSTDQTTARFGGSIGMPRAFGGAAERHGYKDGGGEKTLAEDIGVDKSGSSSGNNSGNSGGYTPPPVQQIPTSSASASPLAMGTQAVSLASGLKNLGLLGGGKKAASEGANTAHAAADEAENAQGAYWAGRADEAANMRGTLTEADANIPSHLGAAPISEAAADNAATSGLGLSGADSGLAGTILDSSAATDQVLANALGSADALGYGAALDAVLPAAAASALPDLATANVVADTSPTWGSALVDAAILPFFARGGMAHRAPGGPAVNKVGDIGRKLVHDEQDFSNQLDPNGPEAKDWASNNPRIKSARREDGPEPTWHGPKPDMDVDPHPGAMIVPPEFEKWLHEHPNADQTPLTDDPPWPWVQKGYGKYRIGFGEGGNADPWNTIVNPDDRLVNNAQATSEESKRGINQAEADLANWRRSDLEGQYGNTAARFANPLMRDAGPKPQEVAAFGLAEGGMPPPLNPSKDIGPSDVLRRFTENVAAHARPEPWGPGAATQNVMQDLMRQHAEKAALAEAAKARGIGSDSLFPETAQSVGPGGIGSDRNADRTRDMHPPLRGPGDRDMYDEVPHEMGKPAPQWPLNIDPLKAGRAAVMEYGMPGVTGPGGMGPYRRALELFGNRGPFPQSAPPARPGFASAGTVAQDGVTADADKASDVPTQSMPTLSDLAKEAGHGIYAGWNAIAPKIANFNGPSFSNELEQGAADRQARMAQRNSLSPLGQAGDIGREYLSEAAPKALAALPGTNLPLRYGVPLAMGLSSLGPSHAEAKSKVPAPSTLPYLPPELEQEHANLKQKLDRGNYDGPKDPNLLRDTSRLKEIEGMSEKLLLQRGSNQADLDKSAGTQKQTEWNNSVARADQAFKDAMAQDRHWSDTWMGNVYNKTGVGPLAVAGALGALTRAGSGLPIVGKPLSFLDRNPMAAGAIEGALAANWPDLYEGVYGTPTQNPLREAYLARSRELPIGHPEKDYYAREGEKMPTLNPVRESAKAELYDPLQAAERSGAGVLEGMFANPAGRSLYEFLARGPRSWWNWRTGRTGSGPGPQGPTPGGAPQGPTTPPLPNASQGKEKPTPPLVSPPAPPGPSPSSGQAEPPITQETATKKPPLADRLEAGKKAVGPVIPAPVEAPPGAPPRPTTALDAGYEWHFNPNGNHWQPRHKDGTWGDKPKAVDSSSINKNKPNGRGTTEEDAKKIFDPEDKSKLTKGMASGGEARKAVVSLAQRYATGGSVRVGPMTGSTGGRTDALPIDVASGSYIIPADVVCAMPSAENNTAAGMKVLEKMFGKSSPRQAASAGGKVPIKISDGEFIVSPDQVAKVGGGDLEHGHRVLDAMVKKVRANHVATLQSLPPPAR